MMQVDNPIGFIVIVSTTGGLSESPGLAGASLSAIWYRC